MINIEVMQTAAQGLYLHRLIGYYGAAVEEAIVPLLEAIREIYKWLPYEAATGGLVVIKPLEGPTEIVATLGEPSNVVYSDLPENLGQPIVVCLTDEGPRIWLGADVDTHVIANLAIVYRFDEYDVFQLPDAEVKVDLGTGYPSVFALPTFFELEENLQRYAVRVARRTQCGILAHCWDDDQRLVLRNKPEVVMRDSLTQFLRLTLREHEVVKANVEQVVDETHPVDIKVEWLFSNRYALIEVKWIGDSWNPGKTAVLKWRGARAQAGAKQLAEYLEANVDHTEKTVTFGYLVVFDARRAGLGVPLTPITAAQGMHYKHLELTYDPDYSELRPDFKSPIRMFMEPRIV